MTTWTRVSVVKQFVLKSMTTLTPCQCSQQLLYSTQMCSFQNKWFVVLLLLQLRRQLQKHKSTVYVHITQYTQN